ncbi:MAG: (2Fe-2S)-binding protein [Paracoccaceae bacterium]
MIICSCSGITDRDIRTAITWMRAADANAIVTPGKVYRALGRKPECGGCIRLFVGRMRTELAADAPPDLGYTRPTARQETTREGRSQGHRISQPRAQE